MSESIFLENSFSEWWILGEINRISNNYDWNVYYAMNNLLKWNIQVKIWKVVLEISRIKNN